MTTRLAALLLVIGVDQTPPAPPPRDLATQPVSAAISGLISEQGSGHPLPRALVTLWTTKTQERSREVVADAQGKYEITGIEPGEYTLFAGPGEMRATHLRQAFGQPGPMDVSMGMPRPNIELKAGEVRPDVNIVLARALAIEGRILDQREEPMAEVEVRLVRADGTPGPSAPVYSDDRGAFRLWGLARGRYRVCATAHNRFLESRSDGSRFVRTCHLASTSESTAVDVVLEDEDATGIDIRVQRAGTYTASGSVTDAAGSPVDGAFVGALRDDREVSGHATTQGGQFVLKGLVPGRYLLHAGVGGPADPGDLRPPARDRELGFATFVVDGSDVSGVDVPLSKGRTVAGRIVFDGGRPPRASSLRIVVQTRAADPAWGMTAGRPPFSPVDDKLQFELKELFQLPLVVGLDGVPEGWATKEIQFDGHDVIDLPVNFGAASSRARLDIVLTNRVAATAVRVADEQGAPVTSYQVVILPADANRWKAALWHVPGMPSRDGELKLGPRVPGDYLLAALPQEDYHVLLHKPARLASIAAAARRVTLVEGENRIVELRLTRLPVTQQ